MGPRRNLGIYVGFQSPSIIRYLDPDSGDLFIAHMSQCEFDEIKFPKLVSEDSPSDKDFNFEHSELHKDPYNGQGEKEVRRILHLHRIAQNAPDAFTPTERITRSDLNEASNYPVRVALDSASARTARKKRGRPKGAKDKNPRKRSAKDPSILHLPVDPLALLEDATVQEEAEGENDTINSIVLMSVMFDPTEDNPKTLAECKKSRFWPKWLEAMKRECTSLSDHEVHGPVQECPKGFTPIGCRWIFTIKRDQNGNIIRFKARLVAQGFTQVFGVDYSDTYSPVMNMTTLRWLIAFAARNGYKIRQADIETAYLYGWIDVELYMKLPEGISSAPPRRKTKSSPST